MLEGGLKLKSINKKSCKNKPVVTIITVVYNGVEHLEETIQSIINQTFDNMEYIIIDGASTDGSIDIIKKYKDKIDYWMSERDSGIYNAMNKGIDLASGDWVNFMNAGDGFFDNNTLQKIFFNNNLNDVDVIYGNHKVIYPYKTRIAKAGDIKNIWKGSQFCHQSAFVSLKVHKVNKFNISNRIGADFEFFYTLYRKRMEFRYINTIVVNYSAGGLSDIKRIDSIVGWWNVVEKNTKVNLHYIWIVLKEMAKEVIKNK